jgi:predicted AlkP superfamily pyrophosphatase or phosphodiesterase
MNTLVRSRKKLFVSFFVVLQLLVIIASAWQAPNKTDSQTSQVRRDAHVVMISIDGLIPEYYTDPAPLGLRVPNLTQMKLNGAYADGVEGVYPSVTYPAHTTLITGVSPAVHGIIQNRIFEAPTAPQTREWYWFSEALKSPTLWSISKKAGLVTASVGWPVTVGADIDYNVPEIKDPSEQVPTSKRTIQYSTPGLLAKALGDGAPGGDNTTDGRRTAVSEFVLKNYKPNLMLVHLIALDDSHHKNGPRSPAALETAERMDAYVGRIIQAVRDAGIFDQTTFFLVSDHGFAPVDRKYEPDVALIKEKLITLDASGKPTDWKAAAWPAGGSCAIMLKDPNDKQTAEKVTALFTKLAGQNNSPIGRVLTAQDLKKIGAVPNAVLMFDAAPGISFGEELTGPVIHPAKDYRGTHGQLPSRAEMRSSLIVYGAGARVGSRMALARMIDIGPTAASVLGLTFENAEGSPIRELLKPGVVPQQPPRSKKSKNRNANRSSN